METGTSPSTKVRRHKLTYEEVVTATNNFSPESLLGEGRYGGVYKVEIGELDKLEHVAVRRVKHIGLSRTDFESGFMKLYHLDHPNLVKVIGYDADPDHPLLFSEFMRRGSLKSHLHDEERQALMTWDRRMMIARDVAKGLKYLHDEKSPVEYLALRPSNIFLDEQFHAKLSDFGLAIFYLSHDAAALLRLNSYYKNDIYEFGLLLLELITGRSVFDMTADEREKFVDEVRPMFEDKNQIFPYPDKRLGDQVPQPLLKMAAKLASRCLRRQDDGLPALSIQEAQHVIDNYLLCRTDK